MKPELLELMNFGPFRDVHRADFAELGDFFLICGDTGAGKSTLFDAISYAFYGVVPGLASTQTKYLRYQSAAESDESYVKLTFRIGNSRWRIRRTVPRDRITRNNTVTTDPEEVSLEREIDGVWKNETSGKTKETNNKIISLVRLSADEFSRVILLPQGEFSRFLKEEGTKRTEILSKLFPVKIYESAIKKIKDKAEAANNAAKYVKQQLDALLETFSPDTFDAERQSLNEKVSSLKKEEETIQQEIRNVSLLLDKAGRIANKQKQLKAAEESYQKEIEKRKEDYSEWRKRLDAANRADHIEGFINAHKTACANLDEAKLKLKETTAQLEETEKKINLLEADRSKAENADDERARLVEQKTRIEGAVAAAEEYEKSAKEIKRQESLKSAKEEEKAAIASKIEQIEPSIKEKEDACSGDVLVKLAQDKADAVNARKEIEEKAARTKKHLAQKAELEALQEKEKSRKEEAAAKEAALKEAEAELEQARVALAAEERQQKAAALALSLEEGAPCPVCGSVHHPAPAAVSEGNIEKLGQQVEDAEQKKAEAASALQAAKVAAVKAEGELSNLSSRIKETEEEGAVFASGEEAAFALAAAKEKAANAEQSLKDAEAALKEVNALKKNVEALKNQSGEIDKALQEIKLKVADLQARSNDANKRFKAEFPDQVPECAVAAEKLAECKKEMEVLDQFVKDFARLSSEKARLEGSKNELANNVKDLDAKAASAEAALKEKCDTAGFAAFEDAAAALLPQEQKAALSNNIEGFKSRKSELETQMKGLSQDIADETADVSQELDSEKLTAKHKELNLSAKEIQQKREKDVAALLALEGNHKRWEELEDECNKKEEERAVLSSLSDDLQGNTLPRKIKFESWLLQQYLKKIVEYANSRIAYLSNDQYTLIVGDSFNTGNTKNGLGLEVFDSNTGKTRPVATLSGGETFLVSISLALGLADSIHAVKGAIQLDAVFIDEGFGSLDPECIDRIMGVLDKMRDHRMIGIISHLGDLKERIPEKLEVKKTAAGSCLKQSYT